MSSAQGLITPIGDNDLMKNVCTSQSLNAALKSNRKSNPPLTLRLRQKKKGANSPGPAETMTLPRCRATALT